MGNKIDKQTNIFVSQEVNIKTNIICQKCPLTPIINITSTKEGTIICEYRCPSFHMGLVKLEEMIFKKNSKSKRYGCICQGCKKEIDNTLGQKKFKFCGYCKIFLCEDCINVHKIIKSNHNILDYSKINNSCLYHGNKYKFYCFTCLKSVCTKCSGHNNHSFKTLTELEPNKDFLEKLNFYFNEVYNYFNCLENKKDKEFNRENFNKFKVKNIMLLNFVKDLYKTYLDKKGNDTLNGEIIINLFNLSKFNFSMKRFFQNANTYFNTHLIIKDIPVSSMCSFTNTKASYKIGELTPVFFKDLNIDNTDSMIILRMDYDLIAYNIGKILYFMKEEEKVYFKIEVQDEIKYFFQLKDHIVCISSEENLFFCKLIKIEPYIISCSVLMPDINNITQVYGSVYKSLFIIDDEEYIYKLIPKNDGPNSDFDFSLQIENMVKIKQTNGLFNINNFEGNQNEESEENTEFIGFNNNDGNNNNNNNNNNSYNSSEHSYGSQNEVNEQAEENQNDSASIHNSNNNIMTLNKIKNNGSEYHNSNNNNSDSQNENSSDEAQLIVNKLIMFEETRKSETKLKRNDSYIIKGIVYDYLILKEVEYITARNENSLFIKNKMRLDFIEDTEYLYDFSICNNHVIMPKKNNINFYTIPDFVLVSKVQLNEKINSFLIPNKNMILVIGDHSIEQFELNTWKRISKLMNENILIFPNEKIKIIGNSNELYLFENGIILKFELSNENIFY